MLRRGAKTVNTTSTKYVPKFTLKTKERTTPARLVNQTIRKPSNQRPARELTKNTIILDPIQQQRVQKCVTADQLMALVDPLNQSSEFLESVTERLITTFPTGISPNQFAYLVHIAHRRASVSSRLAVRTYEAMLAKYPADARSHTMMRYALPIYAHQQMFDKVISLYHDMEASNSPIDAVLLGIVVHACSKVHDSQTAIDVYQQYRDDTTMASQNQLASLAFIGARLSNGDMHARGSNAHISVSLQTPFNLIHFTHLIVSLYDSDQASYCMEIVQDLHSYGIEPDLFFYTSVMYTLSSRSLWHESLEIMIDMQRHNVEIDEYCYYYAMLSCAGAGNWRRSFSLMDECKHRGLEMVPQLYEAALITAESARLYDRTRSLVEEMVNNDVHCSVKGYHSLIRQAHAQRDWHWCVRLYSSVMYSPQYHTNPTVNDCVLHSAHELNPRALSRNERSRSNMLHHPLRMTMDELFRFRFDEAGILGPLGWWMLARPFLRTLRERGDSRKHCEQHMLGFTKYLLRSLQSNSDSPHSIGCFPIYRICDKRVANGSFGRNTRVFELTLNANHLDQSIAAVDLILYVVYYQSHARDWPRECREAIKALPFAHDEIRVKCVDPTRTRHARVHASDEIDNNQPNDLSHSHASAPFSDYTIMAPSEIDKVFRDPLAPMNASDDVGDNLRHAVYRAWVTMKCMFTLRPAPVSVSTEISDPEMSDGQPDDIATQLHYGNSSSDFRSVMIDHLRDEYSVVGEPLDDPCCFELNANVLIAWVRREEAGRLKRMVEFNQLKLDDNMKKSSTRISDESDSKDDLSNQAVT